MKTRILNVECPDKIGLVHAISGVLLNEGLNIVGNQEFVDRASGRFFMRTEMEGEFDEPLVFHKIQEKIGDAAIIRFPSDQPKKVVLFASQEHHCLGDLLIRNMFGELNATILAVISNHEKLAPLVQQFGVPFHFISHEAKSREAHEQEKLKILESYQPDYLVTAKYMRILSPAFVQAFKNRIINIHHSFLPAFIGARPYHQAFERGVKVIGATAHFVTDQLDQGPIVVQQVIPVDHSHSPKDLANVGRDVEQIVLAKAVKLVFEDRVFLCGQRAILFD